MDEVLPHRSDHDRKGLISNVDRSQTMLMLHLDQYFQQPSVDFWVCELHALRKGVGL
jgi:hypothetical protein